MYGKLWVAIGLSVVIGLAMLDLRQKRLHVMHEIASLNKQIRVTRQELWDLQVRVSQEISPPRLRQAIERCGLNLVPSASQEQPVMTAGWHPIEP